MTRDLETFSDSVVVSSDPARFAGLWIHFPEDPEGSSTNFLHGRDMRSYGIDVGGKQLVLAGRRFPVTEYGEHQSDQFEVTVVVPHGPNYDFERQNLRDFAESKKTVVARDNRGVVVFGTISGLSEDYVSQGSTFNFNVARVHREEIRVD